MKYYKQQDGVTLLLAVMVTSMLVLIAISVSFLATKDIQASRAALLTEPALGAAKAGAENGLWAVKRSSVVLPDCTNNSTNTALAAAHAEYCKSFSPLTVALQAGVASVFYLYDPNNPNGDIDLNHSNPNIPNLATPPIYTSLIVTNNGGNNVTVDISKIDGTPVSNVVVPPAGGQQQINIPVGPDNVDNRLVVTLQSILAGTVQLYTNPSGGMPSAPTVSATGCSSKQAGLVACNDPNKEVYSRKINVDVGQ